MSDIKLGDYFCKEVGDKVYIRRVSEVIRADLVYLTDDEVIAYDRIAVRMRASEADSWDEVAKNANNRWAFKQPKSLRNSPWKWNGAKAKKIQLN